MSQEAQAGTVEAGRARGRLEAARTGGCRLRRVLQDAGAAPWRPALQSPFLEIVLHDRLRGRRSRTQQDE